jgi:hypothetical protein
VDSEQAFAELGLVAPASAEAIRRAYLRSVRKHPPERDADGFRRVREAYELLRNAPWLWQVEGEPAVPAFAPIETPGTPALREDEAAKFALALPSHDVTADLTNADSRGPSEGSALEAQASPADILVAAEASGVAWFSERLNSINAALRADLTDPAATLLLQVLTAPPSAGAAPFLLPVWQALDTALRLIEEGEFVRARELVDALERRTVALGVGAAEIGAPVIARWSLVSELLALDNVVASELVCALAQGVRSGNFDAATDLFESLRTNRGRTLNRALAAKAPNLHRKLVKDLTPPRFRKGFTNWSWVWVAYFVFQFVRNCMPSPHHETRPPQSNAPITQTKPLTVPGRIDEAVRLGDCNTVREQWPFYVHALGWPIAAEVRDHYAARRVQALAMCPELRGELSETP